MAESPQLRVSPENGGTLSVREVVEDGQGEYAGSRITYYYPTVEAAEGFRFSHLSVKTIDETGEELVYTDLTTDLVSHRIWSVEYESSETFSVVTEIVAHFITAIPSPGSLILRSATSGMILRGDRGTILHDD